MSPASPARRRLGQALIAAIIGALLLGLGLGAVWRDAARTAAPAASGLFLPSWSSTASQAARIEITASGASFSMDRRGEGWVMASRGNYPVRAERVAELDAALSILTLQRAMTRDPDKYPRLQLDDPAEGGSGVRLRVLDAAGGEMAALIAGATRGESDQYVRRIGGSRAYAVQGRLPPLADPGRWMGLEFWTLDASAVARAEIQPESGPVWRAQRAGIAQRNYELRAPSGWRLVTGGAANGVAIAGAQVRFRDVRPADTLAGDPVSRHSAVTFSGLAYELRFFAEGPNRWAVIDVTALADDAQARADHFNARVDGWAFLVSEDAYERLTRPLTDIAEPVLGQTGEL